MDNKVTINTKKEMIKFLNSFGVAKHLKFFATMLLVIKRKFQFHFGLGGDSFFDGKDITIGVPEYLLGHTKEEILGSLRAMTGHETEHMNSTPFIEYEEFIKNFSEYFNKEYKIDKNVGMQFGSYISNCVEDGRIERLLVKRAPGILPSLRYFRGLWYLNNPCNGKNELNDNVFVFCTLATMGQFPCDYFNFYGDNYYDMWRKARPYIYKAVDSDDFAESCNYIWTAIYLIEDWLATQMKKIKPEDAKSFTDSMMKKMPGSSISKSACASSESSSGDSSKSSGSSKSGGISKTPISPKKEEDDSKDAGTSDDSKDAGTSDDSEEGDGKLNSNPMRTDSINDIFGHKDSGKKYSDRDAKDIIRDAMKNAEKEVNKDEAKNVAQASYDDMLEKKKEGKTEGTSLSSTELKSIRDGMANTNRSWDCECKFYYYNYDLLDTPLEVKNVAKPLYMEFKKIFLNKVANNRKNRKRGILDTQGLWKMGINDYNVFMKKGKPNNTDYVFYLLIDGSGSMSGNKYVQAFKAASILEEAIVRIAPLKICRFDCEEKVNHCIVKDFNQVHIGKSYSYTFINNNEVGSCNMDGYSIRIATNELVKRPERRKVLIILSDGLPSGYHSYYGKEAENDVKNATREARQSGIDVFNIMFGSKYSREQMLEEFKYMYEKCIIACEPDMIATNLLKIIKRELLR